MNMMLFSINTFSYEYEIDLNLGNKFLSEYSYTPSVNDSYKKEIDYKGKKRSYFSYIPRNIDKNTNVLVALHGAGRTGASMIDTWYRLAEKYSFIIIAPNSKGKKWNLKEDYNDLFIQMIIRELAFASAKLKKIYLFGHSNGAKLALTLKTKKSDMYRAVVAHAGTFSKRSIKKHQIDPNSIDVALYLGDSDHIFSIDSGRKTVNWLASLGIHSVLYILKDHTHWYYHDAETINETAWKFFEQIK